MSEKPGASAHSARPGAEPKQRAERGALWRALRKVRHAPDQLLHANRRRAALRELARRPVRSVLFLCHGNVCRSPLAAVAFSRLLPPALASRIVTRSAGFISPGRPAPAAAIAAAERIGYDLVPHRSAIVTGDSVRAADVIVVMNALQANAIRSRFGAHDKTLVVLGDLDPESIDRREIRDPWGRDDATFDASYERILRCVSAMIDAIAHGTL